MRYLRFGFVLLACLGYHVFAQQQTMSVDELVRFLRSSIANKTTDKEIANFLSKDVRLTQKLPNSVIEQLQTEGLKIQSVTALRKLGASTASLPAPSPEVAKPIEAPKPSAAPPPGPLEKDWRPILEDARDYAMNYSKSLPNFICLQVTKRYGDQTGAGNYHLYDTVSAKLTYFDQKEKYDTLSVNDKYTTQAYESLGGSISTGEFGSMLIGIFDPQSAAEFHWARWANLHGRLHHVFSYAVDQPNSRWQLEDRQSKEKIVPAYIGFVWVDAQDHTVARFTMKAVDIPATFSIKEAESQLDYATVDISGAPFILPALATMHMKSGKSDQKNEIAFRAYHKYSATSDLKFDDIVPEPQAPAKK